MNVNLFWLDASRELSVIRRALAPQGILLLIYEPPAAAEVLTIADRLAPMLAANGFRVEAVRRHTEGSAPLLAVSARPIPTS
ncbi:hypothetical protein QNA08_02805 [Chelatococcus sp. SYSU_G07232]|uniref:Methyltransferase n=1 Tax=Chelatococcus albus TaxID=3047466 RepID=A0ABT7ACS2_9HYPH|nr:hypothetical protein [Chelatococcus sp. SYSU_G07232]MDJ1157168.1 hypothetical protein [Chelatococcus sp. SYSU_G07232]